MLLQPGGNVVPRMKLWGRRLPLGLRIGLVILLFHVSLAISGPFWIPYGPAQLGTGIPALGISLAHPLGVDQLGRDVFSRVVYGAHIVLLLSISGTALGCIAGSLIGLLSAYVGSWLDEILQRAFEALISIPFLILGLVAIVAAGPDYSGEPLLLIFVIALVYFPRVARIARSAGIEIVKRDYVTVARLRGETTWSVIWHELLPNASGPLLVEFALRAGYAPVLVGSFGFLGFGMRPPTPEWGLMISENKDLLLTAPITVIGPGIALASLVVGLNMFTEGFARVIGRNARIAPQ